MTREMLKDFIGKECNVTVFNSIGTIKGTVLDVDEQWIKIEEKKNISVINCDMIVNISAKK